MIPHNRRAIFCGSHRGLNEAKPKSVWVGLGLCLLTLMLFEPLGAAKQKPPATKTISGQVLNASSEGILGASVLLTDLQTHKTDAIYSGANGAYNFSGLDTHHDYQIQAKYNGMTSGAREVSSLDPRLQIVVNLTIAPGASKTQGDSGH